MIFFPYKADIELKRLPIITVIVIAACIFVFLEQRSSAASYVSAVQNYCTENSQRAIQTILRYLPDHEGQHPCGVLLRIHRAADSDAEIEALAEESTPMPFYANEEDGRRYIASVLREHYSSFASHVPHELSESLVYDPKRIHVGRMLTSVLSHGDWAHLIGNLLFFYAFAAAVELIGGYALFAGLIATLAVSTSLAYSYSVADADTALPTLGLSGVVMGMIAFVAAAAPTIGIRCFFWFLIYVRRFTIPSLLLAAWYIGWDIYDLTVRDPESNINYVAHVSGAATGALAGLVFRLVRRDYLEIIRS